MSGPTGEMSFLEHLEELRWRILKSVAALCVGFLAGWWAVDRFQLVSVLKEPIAPYLPNGRLAVLSPTEPVVIVLKLSFFVGLVLASPVILYQVWAFLSPALYQRERRTLIPALVMGLVLFLTGAVLGYIFVVPQSLRVLFSFGSDAFVNVITYQEYFDFILQVVLALGLSCELPLVIMILASLGLVTPKGLSKFRRFAIILSMCAGAILSPGTDVITMIIMTLPLVLLYEVGFLGTVVISRRRARRMAATAAIVIGALALALPGRLSAQKPIPRPGGVRQGVPVGRAVARLPGDTGQDSLRARAGQPIDTAQARRLGLPTAPAGSFLPPDSIVAALLARPGYVSTRFRSDSATMLARERRIRLFGSAATEREGSTLEARAIDYEEQSCILDARGDPKMFGNGSVLVSEGLRYDTCRRRAVVSQALTSFQENGANWFLRGDLAQDSSSARLYAASSNITSCDLPVPHYHFAARQVKWISKNVLVARPAVLYVRDVPILWLPFIFQDGRPGRHSGILVPHFGISDIVRPTPTFNRSVTNAGYYWAPNEYVDLTARLDWYANRYVQYGLAGQYRWLDRFTTGSIGYSRQVEDAGNSSTQIVWNHQQNFDVNTTLRVNLNYASNSRVVTSNAVDPLLTTQQILSAANFSRRFAWGTVTLGGNRRQNLNDGSVTQQFPALTVVPAPIALSRSVTWSPALTFTQDRQLGFPGASVPVFLPGGARDTLGATVNTRSTTFNLDTPLRFGDFTWRNSLAYQDQLTDQRQTVTFRQPDLSTPDPNDSTTVTRVYDGNFSTGLDWQTGVNLPLLFRGSWKLQPTVGVANATGAGPFLLRNRNTGGSFVRQGKRFQFSLSSAPTFFGFLNHGIGPIARIRHSIQPIISYSYSPAASVPLDYARAVAAPGQAPQLTSPATQLMSVGLNQVFEAKGRPQPGDTSAEPQVRKYRLLSINTSSLAYDFEQAKRPGRTGWVTPSITNAFQTDLLPGFTASLTHDLWKGQVGSDTAKFDPFLTNVSLSFAVSGGTFRSIGRLFGLGGPDTGRKSASTEPPPPNYVAEASAAPRPGYFGSMSQFGGRGGAFSANVNLTVTRTRPTGLSLTTPTSQENLGFSTTFSPTPFWSASWSSQYNITQHRFESHIVRLERDLHDWKASFNFVQNANGNFAFFFTIFLTDLPDIKFDYNQTTLQPSTSP